MRHRKFVLGEETPKLDFTTEIIALTLLLDCMVEQEKYEMAALIKTRIEVLEMTFLSDW